MSRLHGKYLETNWITCLYREYWGNSYRYSKYIGGNLRGCFKDLLFLPLFGEDVQFDDPIFQMGGSTANQ